MYLKAHDKVESVICILVLIVNIFRHFFPDASSLSFALFFLSLILIRFAWLAVAPCRPE